MSLLRAVVGVLLAGSAVLHAAAYAEAGDERLLAPVAWIAAGLAAATAAAAAGARVDERRTALGIRLLAAAAGVWTLGAAVRLPGVPGGTSPGAADALWVAAAAVALAAIVVRAPRGAFAPRLFLLDAVPVVLLALGAARIASGTGYYAPLADQLVVSLVGPLYLLLGVLAAQVLALEGLRLHTWPTRLLAAACATLAAAALVWPIEALGEEPAGHASDGLWSLGWAIVAAAAVVRLARPQLATSVPLEEREGGLRTLPPALALLASIVLTGYATPERYPLQVWFTVAAFAAFSARYYLARRDSRRLLAAAVAARAEAERAERLKDEFLALVSHELRTPLTSIHGYLELLLDDADQLTEEQLRFLRTVQRNAERLLRLVADLLLVAQIEAGRLTLERAPVAIDRVAEESVEAARPAAAAAGVDLVARLRSRAEVDGDRARLGQVLDNLVSNAIKFGAGGRVEVAARRENGRVVVEVTDEGPGIPLEEQARLFQPFYRTASATERAIQGTGLGLAIARALTEAHGGELRVRSAPGEGTTFVVDLRAYEPR